MDRHATLAPNPFASGRRVLSAAVVLSVQFLVCLVVLLTVQPPFVEDPKDGTLSSARLLAAAAAAIAATCALQQLRVSPLEALPRVAECVYRAAAQ